MKKAKHINRCCQLLITGLFSAAIYEYVATSEQHMRFEYADITLPVILISSIAAITALYALFKDRHILSKPISRPKKTNHSDTDYIMLDKFKSTAEAKERNSGEDIGIGTGVVKIFQQIKDNLGSPDTLDYGYRHLLKISCENLEFDAGAIFLIDKDGAMKLHSHSGLKTDSQNCYLIEVDDVITDLFQSDVPRFEPDLSQLKINHAELIERFNSAWLVPLMPSGTEVGLIIFLHTDMPYNRENFLPKLDFVAMTASWFYENHNNQILIEKENRRSSMLVKTSLAISMSLDLDKVCNILVEQLGRSYGCSYSYIFLNEGDGKSMYIRQFFSERGEPVFAADERFIDISGMSWLKDIVYLGNPVLMAQKELDEIPGDDAKKLKISGSTGALIAPLKHAGKFEGVLVMVEQRTGDRNSMEKEVVSLTAALVAQASAAIENARMYALIKDRVAHLSTLFDVSQALNSDLDLIPFLEKVLKAISKNFNINNCAFLIKRVKTDELYVAATYGKYHDTALGRWIKIGEGITGEAALHRKSMNIGDVTADDRFIISTGKTGSELAVPVILNNEVVGVLDVESQQKFAFSRKDEELLKSIVDQVAVAIEKIKLKQLEKERASKLAITNSIVKRLSGILDKNALLGEAVKGIKNGYNFELVAIFSTDGKGRLSLAQQGCRFGHGYEPGLSVESPNCLISQAARDRENKYSDRILSYEPESGLRDVRTHYCIPLIAGNQLHGVLEIQDLKLAAISAIDKSTLQTIADFISITLNNILLYRDTTDKAERLVLASQISQAISSTLDLEELFTRIADSLSRITGYHWATLIFKEDNEYKTSSEYFKGYNGIGRALSQLNCMSRYFEDVSKKGKPTYYNVGQMKLDSELKKHFLQQDVNYLAIAPINRDKEHTSFLLIGNPNTEGFRPKDQYLLTDVAQHLRIALNNAMLYSELKKAYESLSETQEKLIQSEKFKALGELAAGIAHDFKNIMAAIMGRAQMLTLAAEKSDGVPADTLLKSLEVIEKSANDGVNILSRINEFTKNPSNLSFKEISLSEIINDTIEMSRPRWQDPKSDKQIEVKANLMEGLNINGDRAMMVEVFSNLIYNAVDAIEQQGIITINAYPSNGNVTVEIMDNGTGMDESTLKKIFDPFFTTKERLGTGLGLAMVYSIINNHDGEISAESEPGKGTRFTINLPLVNRQTDLDKLSILIIEDDKNLRNVLMELFIEMKAEVSLAGNLQEAAGHLNSHTFDLILTDLGLAGGDGWKIIDMARASGPNSHIVPVTGWNEEIDHEELADRGLTDVLQKPFNLEQINEIVKKLRVRRESNVGSRA